MSPSPPPTARTALLVAKVPFIESAVVRFTGLGKVIFEETTCVNSFVPTFEPAPPPAR